jgi:hypothetical protein
MTQAEKRIEWEQRLSDYESSGRNAIDWCADQQIKLANFYYWRKRLKTTRPEQTVNPISWLPLEFDLNPLPGELTADQISIEIDGRYKVVVQKGFDREQLQDVISVLNRQCLAN